MTKEHIIETEMKVPRLGVMLVGLGGNNGSTMVAGIFANKKKMEWDTRNGRVSANFYGSLTQCATVHVGYQFDEKTRQLHDAYMPVKDLLPMVNPVDFEISGWDISGANLFEACKRAKVLEPDLLNQLRGDLEKIKPLRAAFKGDFIASNQSDRADNIL
jgi:myo-inositol-1-phosphate synthase